MKLIGIILALAVLTGCSTVAGAGKDLTSAAEWSKEKISQQL